MASLEIPVGITSVPDYAFYGVRLSTINITHGVTTIGKYAFIEGDPTGIREVHESHSQDADYHDLSGKCLDTPKQGLNIIRMSDGTVRKVMVK